MIKIIQSTLWTCFIFFAVTGINAQFPTACVHNATLPNATCCPIPEGATLPCGGRPRGRCVNISQILPIKAEWEAIRNNQISSSLMQDDRIGWPYRFFIFACSCGFKYDGPSCERCSRGWTGPNCTQRATTRIRRNVMNMTISEQNTLRDVINASKYTPSNWSVMSIADAGSADPATPETLQFYNVSVYDYLVYQHFYATRSTMLDNVTIPYNESITGLNFAYKGPGFLAWHRYHLLQIEDELAYIAETQFNVSNFSLAYWDWTGKTKCEICTNDLIGGFTNPNIRENMDEEEVDDVVRFEENTHIDKESPFASWRPFCSDKEDSSDHHTCDLESREFDETPGLWEENYLRRKYSSDDRFQRLPTQEEVDFTLEADALDEFPFNENSLNTSFRNCLEGFAQVGDNPGPYNMNNLVRKYVSGSWSDPATSPNDPLYIFHYAYVDKLFNLFLRSKNQTDKKYPFNNTAYGHTGFEPIVPSFPPVRLLSYSLDSNLLGYDYDDDLAGSSVVPRAPPPKKPWTVQQVGLAASSSHSGTVPIVFATILSLAMVFILCFMIYRKRFGDRPFQYISLNENQSAMDRQQVVHKQPIFIRNKENCNERTPLLGNHSSSRSTLV